MQCVNVERFDAGVDAGRGACHPEGAHQRLPTHGVGGAWRMQGVTSEQQGGGQRLTPCAFRHGPAMQSAVPVREEQTCVLLTPAASSELCWGLQCTSGCAGRPSKAYGQCPTCCVVAASPGTRNTRTDTSSSSMPATKEWPTQGPPAMSWRHEERRQRRRGALACCTHHKSFPPVEAPRCDTSRRGGTPGAHPLPPFSGPGRCLRLCMNPPDCVTSHSAFHSPGAGSSCTRQRRAASSAATQAKA
jgi:hypothetical protein